MAGIENTEEEVELKPAEDNPWYQFLLKSIELDEGDDGARNPKPYGWHWFWGIYYLHRKMPAFPECNIDEIEKQLPNNRCINFKPYEEEEELFDGMVFARESQREATSALYDILQGPYHLETIKEIDFSRLIFSKHVDFSNIIFPIKVSFDDTDFSKNATFTQAKFCDSTRFVRTIFESRFSNTQPFVFNISEIRQVNFQKAEFFSSVLFADAKFKTKCNFQETKFFKGGDFDNATFLNEVNFDEAEFHGFSADFQNAKFHNTFNVFFRKTLFNSGARFYSTIFDCVNLDFDDAIFPKSVFFDGAEFSGHVNFRHTKMTAYMSFTDATFKKNIPSFYGAELYPNIVWNNVNWPVFLRPTDPKDLEEYKKTIQQNQIAYEHLAYQMKTAEKHHDEHFFFRQEMRCRQELEESFIIRSISWLYEWLSGYGYGVARAVIAWGAHICFGAGILFLIRFLNCVDNFFNDLGCAFAVSLANSHSFFFMGERLDNCYSVFKDLPFFTAIWATQTAFGIALLFLLLLTLRIRFRLK